MTARPQARLKPAARPPRAIAYLRASREDQDSGIEAQRTACRDAARRLGLDDGGFYADVGVSGATPLEKRPALLDAVSALGRGDVLLVARRDRLGRDLLAVAVIVKAVERRGARVVSAAGEGGNGDGPGDRLMQQIVDAFSQYERGLIRARTSAALRAQRAQGRAAGGCAPYGYSIARDGNALIVNRRERDVLALMVGWRGDGSSFGAIATALNDAGHRTRGGGLWNRSGVHRILARASTPHAIAGAAVIAARGVARGSSTAKGAGAVLVSTVRSDARRQQRRKS